MVLERQQGIRAILSTYGQFPLTNRTILDIGCGCGGPLASLIDLGAQPHDLYGVDLVPDHIEADR